LAEAVIYCSLAPKSNAVIDAINEAASDVRGGLAGPVPPHLRDSHYPGAKRIEHGRGYRYPHDFPGGVVAQQYAPDAVADREYYRPSAAGEERAAAERLATLRRVLRGDRSTQQTEQEE
jgi:putative ATPase